MLNTASLKMIDQRFITDPTKPGFDGEERTTFLNAVTKHLAAVEVVSKEEEKIVTDRNASNEGKQTALAKLATARLSDFNFLGVLIERANTAKADLLNQMLGPITAKPKGDPMVTFMREQELRHTLNKAEAHTAYLHALEHNDLETARAILDAPGAPWISGDIKQRGEEAYAERTNPAKFERLQAVDHLLVHFAALADSTARWLIGLGADPKPVMAVLKVTGYATQ